MINRRCLLCTKPIQEKNVSGQMQGDYQGYTTGKSKFCVRVVVAAMECLFIDTVQGKIHRSHTTEGQRNFIFACALDEGVQQ